MSILIRDTCETFSSWTMLSKVRHRISAESKSGARLLRENPFHPEIVLVHGEKTHFLFLLGDPDLQEGDVGEVV